MRSGPFAAAFTTCVLTLAGGARAQVPSPPTAIPAPGLVDLIAPTPTPEAMTGPQPSFNLSPGVAPYWGRIESGMLDTVIDSVFGQPDADSWRPLPLSTLFREGWNEAWVPSPNGSGGAPRQGWIGAADGNLYRVWFFTFAQVFNQGPKGNAYLGAYTIFTPLSRRLDLIFNVPFVIRNSAGSGLPIINPTGQPLPVFRSQTTFGDMSFTPRVLLHESKDFSLTAETAVLVPTGRLPLEGKTALVPNISFWNNFAGRWVIRGGIGDYIPLGGGGVNSVISQLTIGQILTDHDVPLFGDFTWYVSTVVITPTAQHRHNSVTLIPGIRSHLGHDWYFLAGLPTPLTQERLGDIGMIFWFMKVW
jgi:hypothetical protein